MFTSEVSKLRTILPLAFCLFLLQDTSAISGGSVAGNSKYVVFVKQQSQFICGAALVARNFAVTGGHCVYNRLAASLSVRGGVDTINSAGGVKSAVSLIIFPDRYDNVNLNMDVAVLKLATPFTGVPTIGLCIRTVRTGDRLQLFGWGKTTQNASLLSPQLRTVTVPVIDRNTCSQAYRSAVVNSNMFCTDTVGRKGAAVLPYWRIHCVASYPGASAVPIRFRQGFTQTSVYQKLRSLLEKRCLIEVKKNYYFTKIVDAAKDVAESMAAAAFQNISLTVMPGT